MHECEVGREQQREALSTQKENNTRPLLIRTCQERVVDSRPPLLPANREQYFSSEASARRVASVASTHAEGAHHDGEVAQGSDIP